MSDEPWGGGVLKKEEVCPTRKGSFKENTLNSFASLEQNIFTLRTL